MKCLLLLTFLCTHGIASWYGPGFHGRPTATGEKYDQRGWTAASRTLPLGTRVLVTNTKNLHTVLLRINDRGPYVNGRVLDVSEIAAEALGFKENGLASVDIAIMED